MKMKPTSVGDLDGKKMATSKASLKDSSHHHYPGQSPGNTSPRKFDAKWPETIFPKHVMDKKHVDELVSSFICDEEPSTFLGKVAASPSGTNIKLQRFLLAMGEELFATKRSKDMSVVTEAGHKCDSHRHRHRDGDDESHARTAAHLASSCPRLHRSLPKLPKMVTLTKWPKTIYPKHVLDKKHVEKLVSSFLCDDEPPPLLGMVSPSASNIKQHKFLLEMGQTLFAAKKREVLDDGDTRSQSSYGDSSWFRREIHPEKRPKRRSQSGGVHVIKIRKPRPVRDRSLASSAVTQRSPSSSHRSAVSSARLLPQISAAPSQKTLSSRQLRQVEKQEFVQRYRQKLKQELAERQIAQSDFMTRSLRWQQMETRLLFESLPARILALIRQTEAAIAGTSVLVVGAGLAGLSAVYRLLHCGFRDVIVLEAGRRIGGRIRTIDVNVKPDSSLQTSTGATTLRVDVGSPWIDFPETDNAVYNLAVASGLLTKDACCTERDSDSVVLAPNRKAMDPAMVKLLTPFTTAIEPEANLIYRDIYRVPRDNNEPSSEIPPCQKKDSKLTPVVLDSSGIGIHPQKRGAKFGEEPLKPISVKKESLKPLDVTELQKKSPLDSPTSPTQGDLQALDVVLSAKQYERERRRRLINQLVSSTKDLTNISIEELTWTAKTLLSQSSLMMGDPDNDIAIHTLGRMANMKGKQDEKVRLRDGMAAVFNMLKKAISTKMVRYQACVKTVDWSEFNVKNLREGHNSKVNVTCVDGRKFRADHVIMTIPLGHLKQHAEGMFVPRLPENKLAAIARLGWASVSTVALVYNEPLKEHIDFIWGGTAIGNSRISKFFSGSFRLKTHPFHNNILELTTHFGMEELADQELVHEVSRILKANNIRQHTLVSIYRSSWRRNPHFLGTHPYLTTACDGSEVAALAKPLLLRDCPVVQFAGDATHDNFRCLSHGAMASGEREADRLVRQYDCLSVYANTPG